MQKKEGTYLIWAKKLSMDRGSKSSNCWCRELTTLWVVRLDDDAELKVTDPKEQQ